MTENIPEWDNDPILRDQLTETLESQYIQPFRVKGKNGIWPFLFSYYDHKIKIIKGKFSLRSCLNVKWQNCNCPQCVAFKREKYEVLMETTARYEEFTGKAIDPIDLANNLEREGDKP